VTPMSTPTTASTSSSRRVPCAREVKKVDNFGQERLAVFFHRIIMPDGYSLSLDQFKGLNQIGGPASATSDPTT